MVRDELNAAVGTPGCGPVRASGRRRSGLSSGSTAGVAEMRVLKNIDVAFVCMNLSYTVPPEEAAAAVKGVPP
jgi:hypothetical protein